MIQDIKPKKFYNQYQPSEPKPEDLVLSYDGRKIFTKAHEDNLLDYPTVSQIGTQHLQYLFRIDDRQFFLYMGQELPSLEGYDFVNIMEFFNLNPHDLAFAGMSGYHLYHWYSTTKFCGCCGTHMRHHESLRAMVCPECGNMVFPRLNPAVIIAVIYQDKLLMTRYRGREYKGASLIAGFVEFGETAEETVAREVMEEAGIHVKNIHPYKTQPWGIDQDLLLGYVCEADDETKIHLDTEELAKAAWVAREDIPDRNEEASMTWEMVEAFKQGLLE